jgi:hypothetical protein
MLSENIVFDERDPRSKAAEKVVSQDALKNIHDELSNIRNAGNTVGNEMWGTVVICEPPPVTPRCHPVEKEPNPWVVEVSMDHMTKSRRSLQQDLDALSSTLPAENSKAQKDFSQLVLQMSNLNREIEHLGVLTKPPSPYEGYPKATILEETEHVDTIARSMDKTRKQLQKDLR